MRNVIISSVAICLLFNPSFAPASKVAYFDPNYLASTFFGYMTDGPHYCRVVLNSDGTGSIAIGSCHFDYKAPVKTGFCNFKRFYSIKWAYVHGTMSVHLDDTNDIPRPKQLVIEADTGKGSNLRVHYLDEYNSGGTIIVAPEMQLLKAIEVLGTETPHLIGPYQ